MSPFNGYKHTGSHIQDPVRYDHCNVVVSSLLMDGVATAGFIAMAALAFFLWLRRRRFAKDVENAFNPDAPLAPGKAHIVGVVEWEKGARSAVQAQIEERGSERESSGTWMYEWVEASRKVHVQPFYIRHPSGHRIRVEPGENVRLRDALDRLIRIDLTTRVRVAELTPGETVFAAGELRRAPDPEAPTEGYRGQALGYLLEPLPDRDMFLSTKPLGPMNRAVADFMRLCMVLIIIAFFSFHALFAPFHARRWLGTTVDTHVTALHEENDDDGEVHYRVLLRGAGDFRFVDEISQSDFGRLHEDDAVQVRYVPHLELFSVIGPGATAHQLAYLALPLGFGLLFLASGLGSRRREWYDIERRLPERGIGRLAESMPRVPEHESAPAEANAAVQENPDPENAGSTSEPPSPHQR